MLLKSQDASDTKILTIVSTHMAGITVSNPRKLTAYGLTKILSPSIIHTYAKLHLHLLPLY